MLSKYPINPKELFKTEYKTINLIRTNTKIQELSDEIFSDCETLCASRSELIKNIDRKKQYFEKNVDTHLFEFNSWIKSEDSKYKIYLGGLITLQETKKAYDEITYYFAVVNQTTNKIIKKYHFDFQTEANKPFYHIQSPGRINPYLIRKLRLTPEAVKQYESDLGVELDIPRIPYMPMSFVQLISLIITEFCPSKAANIIRTNEWYGLLKESEKVLCQEFHNKCIQTIVNNNKSLLMDCFMRVMG